MGRVAQDISCATLPFLWMGGGALVDYEGQIDSLSGGDDCGLYGLGAAAFQPDVQGDWITRHADRAVTATLGS